MAHHRSHQPINKPRRAQDHDGGGESKLRTPKEKTNFLGPSQGRPTTPLSRHENHQEKSLGAAVQITFWSKGFAT